TECEPASASAGRRCRHVLAWSGNPCRHSASGPSCGPASRYAKSIPLAWTLRISVVTVAMRSPPPRTCLRALACGGRRRLRARGRRSILGWDRGRAVVLRADPPPGHERVEGRARGRAEGELERHQHGGDRRARGAAEGTVGEHQAAEGEGGEHADEDAAGEDLRLQEAGFAVADEVLDDQVAEAVGDRHREG